VRACNRAMDDWTVRSADEEETNFPRDWDL